MRLFYVREPAQKQLVFKAKKRPRWNKTRNAKRLESLANSMSAAVKADLYKGIQKFRRRIKPQEIYDAWIKGDYTGIINTIRWEELPIDLAGVQGPLREGYESAGKLGIEALPAPTKPHLRFDYKNPRIQRIFERRTGEWIVSIETKTQESIQAIVHRQFTEGLKPRDLVPSIKNSIGLDPRLANAHLNYTMGLREDGLPESKIEVLSEAYYDKLLDYRSTMIARTESSFMMNRGQLEVWKQGANQGLIPASSRKVWVADGNPCEDCLAMDGESVPINDVFVTPDGDVVDIPTEIHPHCMCIMTIEIGDQEEE